jgi:hypothetical protein
MKRIAECDQDALYIALDNIGINVEEFDIANTTTEYLQELYRYLIQMQIIAWKAGKNHNEIIKETNYLLREEKAIIKAGVLLR